MFAEAENHDASYDIERDRDIQKRLIPEDVFMAKDKRLLAG